MSNYKMPFDKGCMCCVPDKHHKFPPHPPYPPYPPHRDKKVALNCGTGTGAVLPITNAFPIVGVNNGIYNYFLQNPIVVGTVSLDARWMFKPTIKIDFSSLINFTTETADFYVFDYFLRLTFRLSRSCDGGPQVPLGTWNYEASNNLDINYGPSTQQLPFTATNRSTETESFGFTWCECQDCPNCCTYIVEITDVQAFNIECASITNVNINAMAVSC